MPCRQPRPRTVDRAWRSRTGALINRYITRHITRYEQEADLWSSRTRTEPIALGQRRFPVKAGPCSSCSTGGVYPCLATTVQQGRPATKRAGSLLAGPPGPHRPTRCGPVPSPRGRASRRCEDQENNPAPKLSSGSSLTGCPPVLPPPPGERRGREPSGMRVAPRRREALCGPFEPLRATLEGKLSAGSGPLVEGAAQGGTGGPERSATFRGPAAARRGERTAPSGRLRSTGSRAAASKGSSARSTSKSSSASGW